MRRRPTPPRCPRGLTRTEAQRAASAAERPPIKPRKPLRLPAELSIVLVGIGLWIRLGILETPVFQALLNNKKIEKPPDNTKPRVRGGKDPPDSIATPTSVVSLTRFYWETDNRQHKSGRFATETRLARQSLRPAKPEVHSVDPQPHMMLDDLGNAMRYHTPGSGRAGLS
jgi:hypothetical protein